jgi:hypothetical protein
MGERRDQPRMLGRRTLRLKVVQPQSTRNDAFPAPVLIRKTPAHFLPQSFDSQNSCTCVPRLVFGKLVAEMARVLTRTDVGISCRHQVDLAIAAIKLATQIHTVRLSLPLIGAMLLKTKL